MRYLSVPGLDVPVSRVGVGMLRADGTNTPAVHELLDAFVAAGGTLIDTALDYGDGVADRVLGEWLAQRDRSRVAVLAKGCHPLADGVPRVTPEAIEADLTRSLRSLRTDYVDLYVLHRDDPSTPVDVLVEALNRHLDAGRIRAFGGSNWSFDRLMAANAYAAEHDLVPFTVSSPGMSLAVASEPMWPGCVYVDDDVRRDHVRTQFPAIVWSAQARGFFSGRFGRDNPPAGDLARVYGRAANLDRLERATELGRQRGATVGQVALAYVLSQPFPTAALVSPRAVADLHAAVSATELRLTPAELRWLETGD